MADQHAPDLQQRGTALHAELTKAFELPGAGALIDEAARIADRLDELDRIIAGKGVLELMRFRLHERWGEDDDRTVLVEVKFDNVLGEARQQALALRQIVATLAAMKPVKADAPPQKGTALDELEARRAARGAGASGGPNSPGGPVGG